jgi:hypothetical protein
VAAKRSRRSAGSTPAASTNSRFLRLGSDLPALFFSGVWLHEISPSTYHRGTPYTSGHGQKHGQVASIITRHEEATKAVRNLRELNRMNGLSENATVGDDSTGRAVVIRRIDLRGDVGAIRQSRLIYRCEETGAEFETLHSATTLRSMGRVWCRGCRDHHQLIEDEPKAH